MYAPSFEYHCCIMCFVKKERAFHPAVHILVLVNRCQSSPLLNGWVRGKFASFFFLQKAAETFNLSCFFSPPATLLWFADSGTFNFLDSTIAFCQTEVIVEEIHCPLLSASRNVTLLSLQRYWPMTLKCWCLLSLFIALLTYKCGCLVNSETLFSVFIYQMLTLPLS